MNEKEFINLFDPFMDEYGVSLTSERVLFYFEELKDFTKDEFIEGLQWWRRERKGFPSPKELRDAIIAANEFVEQPICEEIPKSRISLFKEIAAKYNLNPPEHLVYRLCHLGSDYNDEQFRQAVHNWCMLQKGQIPPAAKKFFEKVTLSKEQREHLKKESIKRITPQKHYSEILPPEDSEEYKTLVKVVEAYEKKKLDSITPAEKVYAAMVFLELRKNYWFISGIKDNKLVILKPFLEYPL